MKRLFCCSAKIVLFCLAFIFSIGSAEADSFFYYYFDQKIVLKVDANQLAVKIKTDHLVNGKVTSQLSEKLASYGFSSKDLADYVLPEWFVLKTEGALNAAKQSRGGLVLSPENEVLQLIKSLKEVAEMEFVTPIFKDTYEKPLIILPTLLLGFDKKADPQVKEEVLRSVPNVVSKKILGNSHNWSLDLKGLDGLEVLKLANALAKNKEVRYAEPNMLFSVKTHLIPNDPDFDYCWGLLNTGVFKGQSGGEPDFDMDADEAWDITIGDPSVIVVVIDSGIQQNHPDINQISGADFTYQAFLNPNGDPYTEWDNHGTAVAGCISARINNGLGTVGVAPGVRVASARAHIETGPDEAIGTSFWTVSAINWAEQIGAKVTSHSYSIGTQSASIDTAYQDTKDAGIVHFVSAGNDGTNFISYPSSLPSVNSVGASGRAGVRVAFSQYGVGLDFLAPGTRISTTDRTGADGAGSGDYLSEAQGTSFSCPYAAGVAALIFSQHPNWSAVLVEQRMQETAIDMGPAGYDTGYGWGHVNAKAALSNKQTITFAPLANKVYGSAPFPANATTDSGLSIEFSSSNPSVATINGSNIVVVGVGTTVIRASQPGNINYNSAYAEQSLTVTKKSLTVTALNTNRVYGSANPSFKATITGFVNGDTLAAVTGTPGFSTLATVASSAGVYDINPSVGTLSSANYSFGNFVKGSLTVNKAALTVKTQDTNRTYGAQNPAFKETFIGFVNGDTVANVSGKAFFTTSATVNSPIGVYQINPSIGTLSANNYYFTNFTSGALTVTKASLTVIANNVNRPFGEPNPIFSATFMGFVNNENESVINGVPDFYTAATQNSPGGNYDITPALGSLNAVNYSFDNFIKGTLTVIGDGAFYDQNYVFWHRRLKNERIVQAYYFDDKGIVTSVISAFARQPKQNKPIGVADINADGHIDLLWKRFNKVSKNMEIYTSLGNADGLASSDLLLVDNTNIRKKFKLVGVSDFNGDRRCDLVWEEKNGSKKGVFLSLMKENGRLDSPISLFSSSTSTRVVGAGSFGGTTNIDLLIEHKKRRQREIWVSYGTGSQSFNNASSHKIISRPIKYELAGVGNYDKLNNFDLLWCKRQKKVRELSITYLDSQNAQLSTLNLSMATNLVPWQVLGLNQK